MRTQLKINGELKDVEIENGEITIIQPNKKDTGWGNSESNYCIDTTGKVFKTIDCLDKVRYDNANLFASTQLAENISRMQKLQRQMFRWQAEHDLAIEKYDAKILKYYLYYHCQHKAIEIDSQYQVIESAFSPCFSSAAKAKECLEVFKDELIWLFTEFKWRMDT